MTYIIQTKTRSGWRYSGLASSYIAACDAASSLARRGQRARIVNPRGEVVG